MIKNARPVSEKAYKCFTERIRLVVREPQRMIAALDLYLSGNRTTYADGLTEGETITFEMLRFEIDRAIDRSARARQRARARRQSAEMSDKSVNPTKLSLRESIDTLTVPETPEDETADEIKRTFLSSRRMRRAADRIQRHKTNWRKIDKKTGRSLTTGPANGV